MEEKLKELFKGKEDKYPRQLEAKFGRILNRIMELWAKPALDDYFSELMIDDRGDRQGFPPEIVAELLVLSLMHYEEMEAKSKKEEDIWANESARKALEEINVEYTPRGFFEALDTGNVRAVKIFIDAGVNLEEVNPVGWTPLMISSFMGHELAAEMLLEAGANVNARDNRGYGPLHWAAYCGYITITEMLIKKGAFVNSRSEKGITPLLQAAARGHTEVVQILLKSYALVNEADEEGWTPLHKAVSNNHKEVVKVLMSSEADPSLKHGSGLTPLAIAKEKNNVEMAELLIKKD